MVALPDRGLFTVREFDLVSELSLLGVLVNAENYFARLSITSRRFQEAKTFLSANSVVCRVTQSSYFTYFWRDFLKEGIPPPSYIEVSSSIVLK